MTTPNRAGAVVRRIRGSVRARTTVLAVAVVGVALLLAAVGMVVAVRRAEVDRVQSSAELRTADLATALDAGFAPAELTLEEGEDRFVQIVVGGVVVAASEAITGLPSLVERAGGDQLVPQAGDADDRWVITTTTSDGGIDVVVGRELDDVEETMGTLVVLLLAGVPLLLVVVGATTWRVAGRALVPVDGIRREADAIEASELHRRVPDPGGDDEVARLARTVNRMLDRLEAAQVRQRRFVSDVSHELRSPVAVLRQHAEVARLHPDVTSLEQLSEVVLAETDGLAALVDDLIVLARTDEGAMADAPVPVDLDDLVLEATRRIGTSVVVDSSAVTAAQVQGNRWLLQRAVRNLVDNAAEHGAGRVTVALTEDGDAALLTVDDDGPGIPAEERERVFGRFVRLDESRQRAGGTGLGLAIVAAVVEAHRGSVHVETAPAGGTRVKVRIPR